MMNKKGVVWSTIIYAIIGIIVLIAVVWIFRKQINEIYTNFSGIIKTTSSESEEVGKGLRDLIEANN
jgi:Na+-driven multidrug efflux pump